MYENKAKLVEYFYETIKDMKVESDGVEVDLVKLLNPQQQYSLIMQLINNLPKTDFEKVLDITKVFKFPKESTHIVSDFKYSQAYYRALLTQIIVLGKALGYSSISLYNSIMEEYTKVGTTVIDNTLEEVLKSINRIIIASYTAISVLDTVESQYEIMENLCSSTMTNLIPHSHSDMEILKKSVKFLQDSGKEVITKDLKNGYIVIQDRETLEVLPPITYKQPELKSIINKYLKTK